MKHNKIIILIVFSILAAQLIASENWAVFDAGSSGTRLFYYNVEDTGFSKQLCEQKIKSKLADILPGDSNLVSSFVEAVKKDLVGNCLDSSKNALALSEVKRILLFSTAGSRDIINALPDKTKYNATLQNLGKELAKVVPVVKNFADKDVQVSVVSGRQEGIYGFFAQYLVLQNEANREIICGKGADNKVKDALQCWRETIYYEVGGSSTQIAFTYKDTARRLARRLRGIVELPKKLSDLANQIYSRSFLGNGGNQLAEKDVAQDANCVSPFNFPDEKAAAAVAAATAAKGYNDQHAGGKSSDPKFKKTNDIAEAGEQRFENCLKLIEAKAIEDKTLAKQKYEEQFTEIKKKLEEANGGAKDKQKKILFFNSAGAWFSTLPAEGTKFKQYENVKDYEAKNKFLCYRQAENKDSQNACLALTLPVYFSKKLGLYDSNLRFVLNGISWTQGAVYFAKNANQNYAEPFEYNETNKKENEEIKQDHFGRRRRMRHQSKKHLKIKRHHLK